MKVKPKHLFEYAALIALSRFLLLLPHRAALAIGWLVAVLGYYVVGYRVATAKARIREVFGDRFDEGAVSRIAWTSLRNMVFNVVETVRMPRVTRRWVADHIDTRSGAVSIREMIEGQGGLLVIPHMGNWDLAGVAVHLLGVPVFFIVGRQSNPLVDAELNRLRQVTGVETIARDAASLKAVVRKLKQGKVLAFMTDLRSKTPGIRAQFLGREANLVGGMALFARQANVPIVPVVLTRRGWTRHHWQFHPAILPDPAQEKHEDWRRMTQQVMDIFDAAIRREPEQYFWFNKRWVLDPLEVPAPLLPDVQPAVSPAASA